MLLFSAVDGLKLVIGKTCKNVVITQSIHPLLSFFKGVLTTNIFIVIGVDNDPRWFLWSIVWSEFKNEELIFVKSESVV